jgi:hypothetical protein
MSSKVQPYAQIANLRLSAGPEAAEQLRKAVAAFENHVYQNLQTGNTPTEIASIRTDLEALKITVQSLVVSAWPGFGTDHLHAAYGDHVHDDNKFFAKQGSQDAVLGPNTIVFDTTKPFVTVPNIFAWLEYLDGSWSALVIDPAKITVLGAEVEVINLDTTAKLKYHAIGS